jgi:hypothetical protein
MARGSKLFPNYDVCFPIVDGSSLISVEGSAPSQGPDANGFANGRFGRKSLEHGRRQLEIQEIQQENLEKSR